MEDLHTGAKDTEGCFVYKVDSGRIGVRSRLNVGDEYQTDEAFDAGELISIDLIRPSRVVGSTNGPFLRLSDGSGWLFEKKYGDAMMTKIPVSIGLWSFVVDNGATGIALRRHPVD